MATAKKTETESTEPARLKLDLDTLTLGDLEAYEDATGDSLLDLLAPKPVIDPKTGKKVADPDDPKGRPLMETKMTTKALIAIAFVSARRENPTVTMDEIRALPLEQLDMGEEETPDPTESADDK